LSVFATIASIFVRLLGSHNLSLTQALGAPVTPDI